VRPFAGFLLRFFVVAAALFALWTFGGVSEAYGRLVALVAQPLMWLLTGFRVAKTLTTPAGLEVILGRGNLEVPMPMHPREMFSGLIPFLALLAASTDVPARSRLRGLAIGVGVLFAFHLGLMILGPYMTGEPQASLPLVWVRRVNKLIDVFYGFYGLVGYAALPFLLWFWLVRSIPLSGIFASNTPAATPANRRSSK
jgi:hypothetical protein